MNHELILIASAAGYFALLLLLSRLTSRQGSNEDFYRGGRRSPWWAVAYGMLGASISGVTFVSVPGMVEQSGMTYLQMCMGFVPGYILVALVLLPIYYRLHLTTIYTYLHERLGLRAYRTGACFFILSKLIGAAVRLYLACAILQGILFDSLGIPFPLTVALALLLIWCYTRMGGIATIVWSDCLQTTVLLIALLLVGWTACTQMGMGWTEACQYVVQSPMSRIFVWDDLASPHSFWKQFLSGIFVVIVMTGLDQDMMQKNLTCRTLQDSRRNMIANGVLYLPVNALFLSLGIILYGYAQSRGIHASGDNLLPALCNSGALGLGAQICFLMGIIAAAFSSADSATTSLTTSICIDLFGRGEDERLRRIIHPLVISGMLILILFVRMQGSSSVIHTIYTLCGYTYGPLLGLFALALFTRRVPRPSCVAPVCIASPLLCAVVDWLAGQYAQYSFGYELLILNGALTFLGLYVCGRRMANG